MDIKRVFLIVLDSLGIGELPDAKDYGDIASNTLRAITNSDKLKCENLKKLGLYNIDGINFGDKVKNPLAAYGRLAEKSKGKDTTTGHFEICGIISEKAFPTYPDGFPKSVIENFEAAIGTKVLCNKVYSGTQVIMDYGREHIKTGFPIVYTSADSVFQIAAHENVIPREKLYEICKIARKQLCGEHNVGRVIARPFMGEYPNFYRTEGRHDYSVEPAQDMLLNKLFEKKLDVIAIGKIYDIFCGKGISEAYKIIGNKADTEKTLEYQNKDFNGLCFVNLVDFDQEYGHRNNIDGYAQAVSEFDSWLSEFMKNMKSSDCLILCADHGCDPSTSSTDHSREYVPVLVYGEMIKSVNLGTRTSFADIGSTICEMLGCEKTKNGKSFYDLIKK